MPPGQWAGGDIFIRIDSEGMAKHKWLKWLLIGAIQRTLPCIGSLKIDTPIPSEKCVLAFAYAKMHNAWKATSV